MTFNMRCHTTRYIYSSQLNSNKLKSWVESETSNYVYQNYLRLTQNVICQSARLTINNFESIKSYERKRQLLDSLHGSVHKIKQLSKLIYVKTIIICLMSPRHLFWSARLFVYQHVAQYQCRDICIQFTGRLMQFNFLMVKRSQSCSLFPVLAPRKLQQSGQLTAALINLQFCQLIQYFLDVAVFSVVFRHKVSL